MRSKWKRKASHDVKTKLFHSEEFSFDEDVLLYELKTGTRDESNAQVVNSRNDSVRKEYNEFIRKLIQDGFFEAVDRMGAPHGKVVRLSFEFYTLAYFQRLTKAVL